MTTRVLSFLQVPAIRAVLVPAVVAPCRRPVLDLRFRHHLTLLIRRIVEIVEGRVAASAEGVGRGVADVVLVRTHRHHHRPLLRDRIPPLILVVVGDARSTRLRGTSAAVAVDAIEAEKVMMIMEAKLLGIMMVHHPRPRQTPAEKEEACQNHHLEGRRVLAVVVAVVVAVVDVLLAGRTPHLAHVLPPMEILRKKGKATVAMDVLGQMEIGKHPLGRHHLTK
mmetsp:Transcript_5246/g.11389  ORF Transcript_5246/g.11389 Transcript_5246/m.11389 type:complete len:223 (+) Transcript_5246:1132-1800(+)